MPARKIRTPFELADWEIDPPLAGQEPLLDGVQMSIAFLAGRGSPVFHFAKVDANGKLFVEDESCLAELGVIDADILTIAADVFNIEAWGLTFLTPIAADIANILGGITDIYTSIGANIATDLGMCLGYLGSIELSCGQTSTNTAQATAYLGTIDATLTLIQSCLYDVWDQTNHYLKTHNIP